MEFVKLGHSGLTVSRIGLGTMAFGSSKWRPWVLDEPEARTIFKRAAESGINFFDTADMYSAGASEELTGKLVAEYCRREEAVVATKVFMPVDLAFKGSAAGAAKPPKRPNADGLSRKRLLHAIDDSLRRLNMDYVDLYQIHRFDSQVPIEETMDALHDIVKAGKARYIGASSMAAWQFAKAQQVARENGWTRFVSMQNHYNLAYREEEREMIPLCRDQGVAILPWSPLARGFLTRREAVNGEQIDSVRDRTDDVITKYYGSAGDREVREAITRIALDKGCDNATIAYAWLLAKGVTAPLMGATRPEQLDAGIASLAMTLTPEDMAQLDAAYIPHPVIGY